jgi:hypothetical protein
MGVVSTNLDCINIQDHINLVLVPLNIIGLVFTKFPAHHKELYGVDFTEIFEKSGGLDAIEMV